MMLEIFSKRQSVRAYADTAVEREKIERCLEAARLAPSACNSQPWRFVVIDEPQLRKKVSENIHDPVLKMNRFALQAPILVALIAEKPILMAQIAGFFKNKPYNLIDIGMAAENFCLQAVEEGLGTCVIGWFKEKAIKRLLQVPDQKRIPLMITLGYPATPELRTKVRKPLDEIRAYNQWR